MRFSMIEMKAFLYILLTNFTFAETGEKIIKANVCVPSVLKSKAGSIFYSITVTDQFVLIGY